jgi:hypothetical protein
LLKPRLRRRHAAPANYDEAKVPAYTLPDPLRFEDGSSVATPADWPRRRAEILRLLQDRMYGVMPERPMILRFDVRETGPAFGGQALRKQVRIWFDVENKGPFIDVLLYLPKSDKPVPAFVGLNFFGNHTVHADPEIFLAESWAREKAEAGKPTINRGNRATAESRGADAEAWQAEFLVSHGYALATAYCGDIDPDFDDGFRNGVHALFPEAQPPRPGNAWGTVAAWAWGLSRIMDYLQTDPAVDARRVAVMGHSRLGKTALWAGATDERFALVISNDSGCGGAALSKRLYGEAIAHVAQNFPHWVLRQLYRYANREAALPFDQHSSWRPSPRAPSMWRARRRTAGPTPRASSSACSTRPRLRAPRRGRAPAAEMPAVNPPSPARAWATTCAPASTTCCATTGSATPTSPTASSATSPERCR